VIIDAGAKLDLKSHSGDTPLQFARSKNRKEIIAMIEGKLAGS
jgi:ankyrin repeat protein